MLPGTRLPLRKRWVKHPNVTKVEVRSNAEWGISSLAWTGGWDEVGCFRGRHRRRRRRRHRCPRGWGLACTRARARA